MYNSASIGSIEPILFKAFLAVQKKQDIQHDDVSTVNQLPYEHVTASGFALAAGSIGTYEQKTNEFSNVITEVAALSIPTLANPLQPNILTFNPATLSLTQFPYIQTQTPDSNEELKLEVINKFKVIPEVTDIYYSESGDVLNFSVILDIDHYDYNLMTKIFENAEFPIKDVVSSEKLINFEYIYSDNQIITEDLFPEHIYEK